MFVLGALPTHHVVALLQATTPQRAAGVLVNLPTHRIDRLLATMDAHLLARILVAADLDRRAALLGRLDDARLAAELALLPMAEAAGVLAALPPERASAQLDRVAADHLPMLLESMPDVPRGQLIEAMDPMRLAELRRVNYERGVIASLRRTSANLSWVPEDYGSNLFVGAMHRLFGVSLCYVDEGTLHTAAVMAAHDVFLPRQVHGVLIVTNAPASAEAIELIRGRRFSALRAAGVSWDAEDNDGVLARALVRLAG
jgi:hypothetical protein